MSHRPWGYYVEKPIVITFKTLRFVIKGLLGLMSNSGYRHECPGDHLDNLRNSDVSPNAKAAARSHLDAIQYELQDSENDKPSPF
jgi:hypothetical protein